MSEVWALMTDQYGNVYLSSATTGHEWGMPHDAARRLGERLVAAADHARDTQRDGESS